LIQHAKDKLQFEMERIAADRPEGAVIMWMPRRLNFGVGYPPKEVNSSGEFVAVEEMKS